MSLQALLDAAEFLEHKKSETKVRDVPVHSHVATEKSFEISNSATRECLREASKHDFHESSSRTAATESAQMHETPTLSDSSAHEGW